LWIAFGRNRGHGHPDSLNLGLVSHGVDLLPDIGYPDFATRDYAKRNDWTSNTISHNTVVVDGKRQQPIWGGRTRIYKRLPQLGLGLMEFGSQAYAQASLYRRTVAVIRRPDGGAYCWDIFRVRGGREHLQSWHGPEGDVSLADAVMKQESQLDLREASAYLTSRMTLDVPPDKPLSLRYLSHPRWRADGARVSLELIPLGGTPMEATLAVNPKPSLRTRAEKLEYLFLRSAVGSGSTLFSTLLVPDGAKPATLRGEALKLDIESSSAAIRVEFDGGWSDTLISCGDTSKAFAWEPEHSLAGGFAWIRRRNGSLHAAFLCGGSSLEMSKRTLTAPAAWTGAIEDFKTDDDGRLWVTCRSEKALPSDLRGEVIGLGQHPERDTAFEIFGSRGAELNLGSNTTITGFADSSNYAKGFSRLCETGQSWKLTGHFFFDASTGNKHGWGDVK
jgi:hypothetical protein